MSRVKKNHKICKHNTYHEIRYRVGFKFILKVGVEELIVNAPRITDHVSAV
jgi:hypothetical protein